MKKINIFLLMLCLFFMFGFFMFFFRENYPERILIRCGLKEEKTQEPGINYTLISWKSSLAQLDYDADIAFFGDSITQMGNFQSYFIDKRIINLGISGDSLCGMTSRVDMLSNVNAEKVFLMAGINGLKDDTIKSSVDSYETLICSIRDVAPDAKLYIQSVLPVSQEQEEFCAKNDTIKIFNNEIENLAKEYGATYINLFDLYENDGYMNEQLTSDGIHLQGKAYEIWISEIEQYIYE